MSQGAELGGDRVGHLALALEGAKFSSQLVCLCKGCLTGGVGVLAGTLVPVQQLLSFAFRSTRQASYPSTHPNATCILVETDFRLNSRLFSS